MRRRAEGAVLVEPAAVRVSVQQPDGTSAKRALRAGAAAPAVPGIAGCGRLFAVAKRRPGGGAPHAEAENDGAWARAPVGRPSLVSCAK